MKVDAVQLSDAPGDFLCAGLALAPVAVAICTVADHENSQAPVLLLQPKKLLHI